MVGTFLRWFVSRFRGHGESGASLVEYALLVALIALFTAAALGYFQDETSQTLSEASSAIVHADE